MLRKVELGVAAVLTAVLIYLHLLAAISAGGLWRDEANTIGLATLPKLGDVARNLQFDSFPIVWLIGVRQFSALFGPMNDPAFRAMGFCIGLGVVGAIWFYMRSLTGSAPLLSLALFAMSPSLVLWGDSARAYGFGILLILITAAFLWRFVQQPSETRFVVALIAAIISVHTLFYDSVLLLAFSAGAVAVCAYRHAWKTAGLVIAIGVVAAASMLPYVLEIRDASSWNALVQMPDYSFAWFWLKFEETVQPAGAWALTLWFGLLVLAIFGGALAVVRPAKLNLSASQREVALFTFVSLVVGVFALVMFLDALSYYTQPWYYLALLALIGVSIDALAPTLLHDQAGRIVRVTGAAVIAAATLFPAISSVQLRHTNADLVSQKLTAMARSDDIVLVSPWNNGVSFYRYYRGAARWSTVPPVGFYRFHRYDLIKQQMMVADQSAPVRGVIGGAAAALRAGHSVFLVGSGEFPLTTPPKILPPAPLPGRPWPSDQYGDQWSNMVTYFIQQHATSVERLAIKAPRKVSKYENLSVLVAKGWRE